VDDDKAPRGRPFLTARWCNLILANYPVPDDLLVPHLPDGLHLDRRDGAAWCSLVAFEFRDTRVLGIPWPGYRRFPEVNLRFYVRHGSERGVVFIREYVQSRLIAGIARTVYGEPYAVAPIFCAIEESGSAVHAEYRLHTGGREHRFHAVGDKPAVRPPAGSTEHFFKEQRWGFGRDRRGFTVRYLVTHPEWDAYPIRDWVIDVDWAKLYGPAWAVMNDRRPQSLLLAAGSRVEVYPKGRVPQPAGGQQAMQPAAQPLPG
jgi:uncharacterized protein YqjF (DUF2071 family)